MSVHLRVYAELNDFVRPDKQFTVMRRPFRPHQTVKDVIEAASIPHTEADLVLVNGESVDFGRILLTRDRGLLKRRNVTHGVFVRSDRPFDQIVEVIQRLDLAARLAPFTRCLRCGGTVAAVAKHDVERRLEPLTRRHYDEFRRCTECGRVYWRGSHQPWLDAMVAAIRAELNQPNVSAQ